MAEYIEREAISKLFDSECRGECVVCPYDDRGDCTLMNQIPPADVQPLEYGEWTIEGNDEYGNYWDECTVCRDAVWFPPFVKNDYKYCPHCGARMDGEDDG